MARGEYREARTPASKGRQLHHLEVQPAEDGGHIVRHHYHEDGMVFHKPKEYVFGEDEGHEALAHIAKHAKISAHSDEGGEGHYPSHVEEGGPTRASEEEDY